MDLNTINDWLYPIILLVVGTLWTIWYTNKTKNITQLSLINQEWVPLVSMDKKNFNLIKFENYNLPINTNIYYFKGTIVNSGNVDIDKTKIYEPVRIILPPDLKILESRFNDDIINKLNLEIKKTENSIEFNWNLIKPVENFSFELLVETSKKIEAKEFYSNLKTTFRITDLKKIERIESSMLNDKSLMFPGVIFTYSLILFLLFVIALGSYNSIKSFYKPPIKLEYSITSLKNEPLKFEYYDDNRIILIHGNKKDSIKKNEINLYTKIKAKTVVEKNQFAGAIILTFFSIFIFLGLIVLTKDIIKKHNHRKLIRTIE